MHAILTSILRLLRGENGATAIEYGLIAAGIALALIPAIGNIGTSITSIYGQMAGWFALV